MSCLIGLYFWIWFPEYFRIFRWKFAWISRDFEYNLYVFNDRMNDKVHYLIKMMMIMARKLRSCYDFIFSISNLIMIIIRDKFLSAKFNITHEIWKKIIFNFNCNFVFFSLILFPYDSYNLWFVVVQFMIYNCSFLYLGHDLFKIINYIKCFQNVLASLSDPFHKTLSFFQIYFCTISTLSINLKVGTHRVYDMNGTLEKFKLKQDQNVSKLTRTVAQNGGFRFSHFFPYNTSVFYENTQLTLTI